MPVLNLRSKAIRATITPVIGASQQDAAPSREESSAQASPRLWELLVRRYETSVSSKTQAESDDAVSVKHIGIAIEWPEDRRLRSKGQRKTLVVWAKPAANAIQFSSDTSELLIPQHLVPTFSPASMVAKVHLHDPVELSLVVLQPVIPYHSISDTIQLDSSDLDLSLYYHRYGSAVANGHANGHGPRQPAKIFRQSDTVTLSRRNGATQAVRILTLDPVQQGVITSRTRIVVTETPYMAESLPSWPDMNGAASESSHGRTNLSMANFDPDAFLASSLDLHFDQSSIRADGSSTLQTLDPGESSHSSTSGSITPRPNGFGLVAPPSPPAQVQEFMTDEETAVGGKRYKVVVAAGPSNDMNDARDDVCWMGVGGLGRAGIFEGDWVFIRSVSDPERPAGNGRLVRALVWEQLDDDASDVPSNPIVVSPGLFRSLFPSSSSAQSDVLVLPTSFGARQPTLPIARTMTLTRIATTEGVDKRYERSWLRGLQVAFAGDGKGKSREGDAMRMIQRGDVISIPVWIDKPIVTDEAPKEDSDSSSGSESEDSVLSARTLPRIPTALAYFQVTALSYEPLNSLEEDFRSSISSKARAGELGCWVDVGKHGTTRMVLTGVERSRVSRRKEERAWFNLDYAPPAFNSTASTKLRDLLSSCLVNATLTNAMQISVLIKGAKGSGKTSLLRSIADELGFNVVTLEGYDIIGDTPSYTEGTILAAVEKVKACTPSILLIKHVEVLSKKAESGPSGRPPAIVKVLEDAMSALRQISGKTGWPCLLLGTTSDVDATAAEVLGCFKQEIEITAPNEPERLVIARNILEAELLDPDLSLSTISSQSAALQANDIVSLIHRARDLSLERNLKTTQRSAFDLHLAGLPLSTIDIDKALGDARASYSDSIGAPKIPNVRWEDVGGLANVKKEILETVQLPLERPELFAEGLKKRSGILLYGPPGTGKTLLAKAVATSCSLNFFSVKGPELLNMYIGESEANVRRVFQRARDASPCIIFMDELDSVAPKRGNQGDSGGVMDRIVSQLLAELDGMGSNGGDVFVMGATNRPDLLDPALLRPGRFDRMLYLSVATTHEAQRSILEALTRKFNLDDNLDLEEVAEACPFNYTGADFYALCSDAMLRAMTRKAEEVDMRIAELNATPPPHSFPYPLTPQYYLASMAKPDEIEVKVGKGDFMGALEKLVPSVSADEMSHYRSVQQQFQGFEIGAKED